jgi:class 3 adenylate cyclase
MSSDKPEVALLLADITGSTPLYEKVGDAAALGRINDCLRRLRSIVAHEGGMILRSKGDDLLCYFADPCAALRAARQMQSREGTDCLAIHAGVHFGPVIRTSDDIFGDAVNLTARLAAAAKPGEVLVSQAFVDQLSDSDTCNLRILDTITFKGKSAATRVYSLLDADVDARTEMAFGSGAGHTRLRQRTGAADVSVTLRYGGRTLHCTERTSLSIGRATDCDVVIAQLWVSREHATIAVRRGQVQLDDRSSSGTYVAMHDGSELFMRRESAFLTGSGTISPAMRPTDARAELIHYEVVRTRRDADP